jgi:hypothetical protein
LFLLRQRKVWSRRLIHVAAELILHPTLDVHKPRRKSSTR